MFANRIGRFISLLEEQEEQQGFSQQISTSESVCSPAAFIACLVAMFGYTSPEQELALAEIYRRALEMTQQQMRKPARKAIPSFSRN